MRRYIHIILIILFTCATAYGVSQLPELQVDNLNINGNTVSSTSGDINLDPTGDLVLTDLTATTVPYLGASSELVSSAVTPTELGYLSGVTSALQTQLGLKLDDFTSTTDNAIMRSDGTTGVAVQDSGILVDDSDNITAVTSINAVLAAELAQLETIGTETISATQWGYLGGSDQAVKTTDTPQFAGVSLGGTNVTTSLMDVTSTAKGTRPFPQMTEAQRDAIASPANGLMIYNTDTDALNQYNTTTVAWAELSGGGGAGSLDIFYTEDAETTVVADFTSGNNATFDNGGTLGGVLADETSAPLNGDASFKYTMNATAASSDDDWIKGPAITLTTKQQGNTVGLTFYYTYTGDDDDMRVVCWDDTNNTNQAITTAYIKSSTVPLRFSIDCPMVASTATLNWGYQTITGNSSKVFLWDDLEFTSNPFVYKDLVVTESYHANAHAGFGSTDTKIPYYTNVSENTISTLGVIVNDSTSGWKFTASKRISVNLSYSRSHTTSNTFSGISINSSQLTTTIISITAADRKILTRHGSTNDGDAASFSGILEVGDIIRVHTDGTAVADATRTNLVLLATGTTENVIGYNSKNAVSSVVRLHTGNGHGSTNTKVRRWTTAVENTGSAITWNSDSSTLGSTFTINEAGEYHIHYVDQAGGVANMGISLNSTQLTTGITGITDADRLSGVTTAASGYRSQASYSGPLSVGDVIRAHTDGTPNGTNLSSFVISKIGKDDLLGIPTSKQSIRYDTHSGYGSTNTKIPYFTNERQNVGPTLLTVGNDSTNGFSVTATVDCYVNFNYSARAAASVNVEGGISLNSTELTSGIGVITTADRLVYFGMNSAIGAIMASYSGHLSAGDVLRVHTDGYVPAAAAQSHLNITAER